MSDDDSSQRTEQPTARRLRRARDEGQVARSVELSAAAVTLAATTMFFMMGGTLITSLAGYFSAGFTFDRKLMETPALLPAVFASQLTHAFMLLLPVMLVVLVVAVLSAGATGGYIFSIDALMPKFSKLSPMSGFKRMFGPTAAVELLKSLLKVSIVSVVLWMQVEKHSEELLLLGSMSLKPGLSLAGSLISEAALWLTFSLVFIALIDVPYQRYTYNKRLRMTKQEIKDEMKDTEGRPEVKAQIRRRQREVANVRMMQKVKEADVIITNPEHFAVALSYDPTSDGAPILLAKGADHMALRIRTEAKNHSVEIFAAPELARALYFTTNLDQPIPDALYFAVAQVIAYVFGLGQVQPGMAPMARPAPKVPASMLFDTDGHLVSKQGASP
ncbi:MAG: flagellar biosynthesis protein FlhB [Burkholderiales bacterium]|nr:flagellar biosynthesis protein FlhB [Burkholderiales bacterium]